MDYREDSTVLPTVYYDDMEFYWQQWNMTPFGLDEIENSTANIRGLEALDLYNVHTGVIVLLALLYGSISLLAILGNGAVIYVVVKNRKMQTVTNIFIVNMAFADVLIGIISIPFQFHAALLQRWVLGAFMCRLAPFVQVSTVNVSIFTLMILAIDRYFAVIHPLKPRISKHLAKIAIGITWTFAVLSGLPMLFFNKLILVSDDMHPGRYKDFCANIWPLLYQKIYTIHLVALQYIMPLTVILCAYIRIGSRIWGSKPPGFAVDTRDRIINRNKKKVTGEDPCINIQDDLGRIVKASVTPPAETVQTGDTLRASVTITSQYKLQADWFISEEDENAVVDFTPSEDGAGGLEPGYTIEDDTYTFNLKMQPARPGAVVNLALYLYHPCNLIKVDADIEHWMNLTGELLPTALNIPKPVLDLKKSSQGSLKAGFRVNSDVMEIDFVALEVEYIRKDGKLYYRYEKKYAYNAPIRLRWDGPVRYHDKRELNGNLVIKKRFNSNLTEESGIMKIFCVLRRQGQRSTIWFRVYTNILLLEVTKPAVIANTLSYSMFGFETKRVYDTDGVQIIPVMDTEGTLPTTLSCVGEYGDKVTYLAAARVTEQGGEPSYSVLPLHTTGPNTPGTGSFATYILPPLAPSESADYICSAAYGDAVASYKIRVLKTEPINVTTPNLSPVIMNEETLAEPYKMSCKTTGYPTPEIEFYRVGYYSMDYYTTSRVKFFGKKMTSSAKYTITATPGESSLNINWNKSEMPMWSNDGNFGIACLASNQFASKVTYVNFYTEEFWEDEQERRGAYNRDNPSSLFIE